MVRFKKFLATAVAFTMIFGCSVTAFADEPASSGSQTGAGASEGHVDKEIKDFVLPTTTATTFKYTMDPERLIQATEAAKYSGATFPENTTENPDTGVYFLVGENTYGNASETVQAINKGAVDQILTVNIKTAEAAGTDIALATAAADIATEDAKETGGAPKLYLGGVVGAPLTEGGSAEQAINATGVNFIVAVAGNANNYEVVYKDNAYSFEKKATPAGAWQGVDITIKGAVTSKWPVAATTTAPTLTVTWTFSDVPDQAPTYTGKSVDVAATPAVAPTAMAACSLNNGTAFIRLVSGQNADASKVTAVTIDGVATSNYEVAASGAITVSGITGTGSHTILITHDGTTYTGTVTVE